MTYKDVSRLYPKHSPINWPAHNLEGQRFGRLLVLYLTTSDKHRSRRWVCKCDCGEYVVVRASNLKKGATKSCGCLNRELASQRITQQNHQQRTVQIGDRFGGLVVIGEQVGQSRHKNRIKHEMLYTCQCDCGSAPIVVRASDLVSNRVHSCGCLHSYGEYVIKQFLEKNHIIFRQEYSFPDLINPKTKCKLRFDFAIFNEEKQLLYLVEYDGRQHISGPEAKWRNTPSNSLDAIQFRDNLKNDYCQQHNIVLVRLRYEDLKNIDRAIVRKAQRGGKKPCPSSD